MGCLITTDQLVDFTLKTSQETRQIGRDQMFGWFMDTQTILFQIYSYIKIKKKTALYANLITLAATQSEIHTAKDR